MERNKALKVLAYASLIALVLPMAACVATAQSATYYYTNDYFKEHFGTVKQPERIKGIQYGTMMYTDSKAFQAKFGVLPAGGKKVVEQLPLKPSEGITAEEESVPPKENETPEDLTDIIIVPVAIAENATINVTKGAVANATGEEAAAAAEVVEGAAEETEETAPPLPPALVITDEIGQVSGGLVAEEKSVNASPSGAAVSSESSLPLQITIIGLLIVVIAAMLAVLLLKKEPKEKQQEKKRDKGKEEKAGDWEEGSFFKEAKEKKEAKLNGSKNNGQKNEEKPFLLKIRDES